MNEGPTMLAGIMELWGNVPTLDAATLWAIFLTAVAAFYALVRWLINRFSLKGWAFGKWLWLLCSLNRPLAFLCYRKSHSFYTVTIDDYVAIIERLRRKIVTKCGRIASSGSKPVIIIYVCTMQLPSDWPLWDNSGDSTSHGDKSPLEQYFDHFYQFLCDSQHKDYTVSLKRVIVIDNYRSPRGQEKIRRLRADLEPSSDSYKKYIQMLHHGNAESGGIILYPRPWPAWLSDAVFYGVKVQAEARTSWLWGITTSYNAGEDLVLLRVHRIRDRVPGYALALPYGLQTLQDFLDLFHNSRRVKPLTTESLTESSAA